MPRTLLPRSALRHSDAVASAAPVDPARDEEILGPESEPTSGPATQPAPGTPAPPPNPRPSVLLVHPKSTVLGAGLRDNAEGPIFARDPLGGADTLVVENAHDLPSKISLYESIGRLVIFVRRIPGLPLSFASFWNRYRGDFEGYALPDVTGSVEFEAPETIYDTDIQSLVNFAKLFKAPRCVVWNYAHGAEAMVLRTRGRKEKDIEKDIKPHEKFLLERTPDVATIVAVASGKPFFEIATEWFDPSTTLATPPRPKKGVLRRSEAIKVSCTEPDYSQADFNEGAKLQQITIEIDLSIPLPPLRP